MEKQQVVKRKEIYLINYSYQYLQMKKIFCLFHYFITFVFKGNISRAWQHFYDLAALLKCR